jgi:hypothetical protein
MAPAYANIAVLYWFEHPLFVHIFLLGGDVVATIVVGWGIVWESPTQVEWRHHVGMWLVIWGVAAETLCSISLFAFDESISRMQQARIDAERERIISLTKENADLERIMLPRRLPAQSIVSVGRYVTKQCPKISRFTHVSVLKLAAPETEPSRFARELVMMLSFITGAGNWTFSDVSSQSLNLDPRAIPDGVTIYVPSSQPPMAPGPLGTRRDNSQLLSVAHTLTSCLNKLFGEGSATAQELPTPKTQASDFSTPFLDPQPEALLILVGENPIADKLWALKRPAAAKH